MKLSLYESENKRRGDYTQVTDKHLIVWDPAAQDKFYPQSGPALLVEGAQGTNFVNKHDFNRRFQLLSYGLLNYIDWGNVIVAGGCASNSINGKVAVPRKDASRVSDVDLFIYGLSEEEARIKITELLTDIGNATRDKFGGTTYILKNEYTITLVSSNNKEIKIQIILRLYKCIYEVLAGFDVDSCAVAYDGHQVYLTERSLNAFQTRMNVVDLSRRSPSYEHRLHKYVERGFGVYIPFDWSGYNKLYFINRHTQGLDRLLILQRYNRRLGLQRLLNYITKRRNIKFANRPVSDYEGDEELDISHKQGLRISVSRYNQKVAEPFKYTIFDDLDSLFPELRTTKFIVHNPGQQLTGSFQPITTGDWITCDYTPLGVDFIGRSTVLLAIKSGKDVKLEDLYENKVRDNSLFNCLDYLIMYHPDEEFLTVAWDNQHRFTFSSYAKNLYDISYLMLAMVCRRYTLVQHIFAKKQEDLSWEVYIDLAMFLDDLTLLKCIYRYHKNSIYDQRDTVKKYRSSRIGKHFGLQLQSENHSLATKLDGKNSAERLKLIMSNGHNYAGTDYHDLLTLGDYQRFTDDELRIYSFKCGEICPLWGLLLQDTRREVVIDDTWFNEYRKGSFEEMWYNCCLQFLVQTEKKKTVERSERAMSIMRQLYPRKRVEEEKLVYNNPVEELPPLVLLKMRKIWERDFEDLNIRIWAENDDNLYYRHLLFAMDDYDTITAFVDEKHMGGFLGKWRDSLGPKLLKKWEAIKEQQVSLSMELHRNYADALYNTTAHLSVLETGKLLEKDVFVENAFGQTPYDYAIGQLLHLRDQEKLRDVDYEQLANLRETTDDVDLGIPVVHCTQKMVLGDALDVLVDRI